MILLLIYVALALGVSFLCSILEAVLLSITPAYVAVAQQQGTPAAAKMKALKRDIDRPLAAILSLNTIAHTVGAAGAGAQAATVFADVPMGVVSGILTLAILVISEIIPKTLGAVHWKALAPWVVRVLGPIMWSMWPLVKLSEGITKLLSKKKSSSVSREELSALAKLGHEQGVLEENESRILHNLFRFSSLTTRSIMTPRIVLFALPANSTVAETLEEHRELRFTRIPLFGENRDQVSGFVLKTDILLAAAKGEAQSKLTELKRELIVVSDDLPLPTLLSRLLDQREHVALVVDEFGGTAGLVTMEDAVETLLGLEIVDESDSVENMQELARKKWLERARKLGIVEEDPTELGSTEP